MMVSPHSVSTQRSHFVGVIAVFYAILVASCGSESASTPQTQQTSTPQSSGVTSGAPVLLGNVAQIDSVLAAQQGRWILINVWATWCRPCVAETPELVALHQSLKDKPFSLIGISADYMTSPTAEEALTKVRNFGIQYHVEFPNVIFSGSTDDLTSRFSLGGAIPTSILYNPQGEEVERWTGRLVEEDFARIVTLVS